MSNLLVVAFMAFVTLGCLCSDNPTLNVIGYVLVGWGTIMLIGATCAGIFGREEK